MDERFTLETKPTATIGIEYYGRVLRRQWLVIAACTVIGVLLAGLYLLVAPRTAVASTTLSINVITTEPFNAQKSTSGLLDGRTETDIADSYAVAKRAAEELGGDVTPVEVRKSATASTSEGASVVKITYSASSRKAAVEGANAVADAYLAFRGELAQKRVEVIVDSLSDQINTLTKSLAKVNQSIAGARSGSAQSVQGLSQQQQILSELNGLLGDRSALRAVDTTGGAVLTDASDERVYFTPTRSMPLLTGAAAGLVIGIVAAFVRNRSDRRFRSAAEVSVALDAPQIAIPAPGIESPDGDELLTARERILADVPADSTVLVIDTAQQASETSEALAGLLEESGAHTITPAADRASGWVAGLRNADAAVVVFDTGTLRVDTARWLKAEAEATATPIVGVIERSPASR